MIAKCTCSAPPTCWSSNGAVAHPKAGSLATLLLDRAKARGRPSVDKKQDERAERRWRLQRWQQKLFASRGEACVPDSIVPTISRRLGRDRAKHRLDFEAMNRAITQHQMRPVIDRVFPFAETKEAYRHFEGRGHFGKVVIPHG
jgi:NADPH:quinone reductase-like Zn-dependent oxidoreductase